MHMAAFRVAVKFGHLIYNHVLSTIPDGLWRLTANLLAVLSIIAPTEWAMKAASGGWILLVSVIMGSRGLCNGHGYFLLLVCIVKRQLNENRLDRVIDPTRN